MVINENFYLEAQKNNQYSIAVKFYSIAVKFYQKKIWYDIKLEPIGS